MRTLALLLVLSLLVACKGNTPSAEPVAPTDTTGAASTRPSES